MEQLTLFQNQSVPPEILTAVPPEILTDDEQKHRPVIWVKEDGTFCEYISHAWMTNFDSYYYQHEKQMDAKQHTLKNLLDIYDRVERQLQTTKQPETVWEEFLNERAKLFGCTK